MNRIIVLAILLCSFLAGNAQLTEGIYRSSIRTPMLFPYGNQMGMPIIRLNSSDQLELHFDDLDGDYKNYYYTYVLCNADWTPAMLSYFDYVRGYSNVRINTFRLSSIAKQRYTHYSAFLPEKNCMPSRSGNYLLKVCLDGDTSKTVFTKRILVVEEKATAGIQVIQPFNSQTNRTHQRMILRINATAINVTNPMQQLKVVALQNNRWDNAVVNLPPTFIRGKELVYDNDNALVFESGREWRWLDLRSFRFWSDRVAKAETLTDGNHIYVKPDIPRSGLRYNFFRDLNGLFTIENTDNNNPYWQSDYAMVHFTYVPANNQPETGKDVYLVGKLSDYGQNTAAKMEFNTEKGVYETAVKLKQGFYSYQYATVNRAAGEKTMSIAGTEGNFWETENTYQVLVYYRALGARTDELVFFNTVSSYNGRLNPGF
ncbi:MAG: DUF5103 domain-containing protein [Dinghuibacter sp.]|nr:DUF5103 domain-containing protein [Dinghuibacter sp.]